MLGQISDKIRVQNGIKTHFDLSFDFLSILDRFGEGLGGLLGGLTRPWELQLRSKFENKCEKKQCRKHIAKVMPKSCQKGAKKGAKRLPKSKFLEQKWVQEGIEVHTPFQKRF